MSYKLYGAKTNPRTRVALIVARLASIDIELVNENPFEAPGLSYEFVAKFPQRKIPALEGPEVTLTEIVAISTYLASLSDTPPILGKDKVERALIEMWCSFGNVAIMQTMAHWIVPLLHTRLYNKPSNDYAKAQTLKALEHLDNVLSTERKGFDWLVGDRCSLADIFVACMVLCGFEYVIGPEWREKHPATMRWFERVTSVPEVQLALGPTKMCESELAPPS